MSKPQDSVQMAVIGAAHGIRGEVRVKTFTADPMALGEYGPLFDAAGRTFHILGIRPAGTMMVVRFEGIATRDAAEALNGTALFVDRSALPADLAEDEFYHADLIGLPVEDETGARIGKVTAVQNFGGGDILEIALAGRKTVMIPFSEAAVPKIDLEDGIVTIDSVAGGLVESGEDDESSDRKDGGFDPAQRPRGPKSAGGNR